MKHLIYCLTLLIASTPVFGATFNSQIHISEATSHNHDVELDVEVKSFPATNADLQIEHEGHAVPSSTATINENVWILVDTSKLCQSFGVSRYFSQLLEKLKIYYSESSTFSIVEYFSGEIRTRRLNDTLDRIQSYEVSCQASELSSSFEQALQSLIDQNSGKIDADRIWILSSGNVKVSDSMTNILSKSPAKASVGLYNPLLYEVVSEVLKRQHLDSYSIWGENQDMAILPPYRTKVIFSVPESKLDEKFNFQIRLSSGETVLASTHQSILVKSEGWRSFVKRNRIEIQIFLSALALFFVIVFIRKYLVLPKCKKCNQPLRRGDYHCLDCYSGSFLIEQFSQGDMLHLIPKKGITIGSSRKADVKIHTPSKKRRVDYRIESKFHKDGGNVFVLIPANHKDKLPIHLNGVLVERTRLIGRKDTLEIDGKVIILAPPQNNPGRAYAN